MVRLIIIAITTAALVIPVFAAPTAAARPKCNGVVATKVGTNGADVIRGTKRRDVIVARGGNDRIIGRGGNDIVCAGGGADIVKGGAGKDRIFGQAGRDKLYGDAGRDRIVGGPAKDACYKGADGATLVSCEEADFAVLVVSPAGASTGVKFTFEVVVRNVGTKPASGTLTIEQTETTASCGSFKFDGQIGPVAPGSALEWGFDTLCFDPTSVTMSASIVPSVAEDVTGNNDDASTTVVAAP